MRLLQQCARHDDTLNLVSAFIDLGDLGVAVVPVQSKLSLKAAAAALGVAKASIPELAAAERATGYVVGGISPFGQPSGGGPWWTAPR